MTAKYFIDHKSFVHPWKKKRNTILARWPEKKRHEAIILEGESNGPAKTRRTQSSDELAQCTSVNGSIVDRRNFIHMGSMARRRRIALAMKSGVIDVENTMRLKIHRGGQSGTARGNEQFSRTLLIEGSFTPANFPDDEADRLRPIEGERMRRA